MTQEQQKFWLFLDPAPGYGSFKKPFTGINLSSTADFEAFELKILGK